MKKLISVFVLGLALFACDSNRVFDDYKTIGKDGWHKDSVVVFSVNPADTAQHHNIYMNIRNKGNYPNSNLWLFLTINSPSGETLVDTVEFTLAEKSGRWKGSGIGDLYDSRFLYRQQVFFSEEGEYTFSIQHGMRADVLKGIHDVGIRIEKQK